MMLDSQTSEVKSEGETGTKENPFFFLSFFVTDFASPGQNDFFSIKVLL